MKHSVFIASFSGAWWNTEISGFMSEHHISVDWKVEGQLWVKRWDLHSLIPGWWVQGAENLIQQAWLHSGTLWPAMSPDLSLKEHLWYYLEHRVKHQAELPPSKWKNKLKLPDMTGTGIKVRESVTQYMGDKMTCDKLFEVQSTPWYSLWVVMHHSIQGCTSAIFFQTRYEYVFGIHRYWYLYWYENE